MPRVKDYASKHGQTPRATKGMARTNRNDNWENVFTGLNVLNKDKRVSAVPKAQILKELEAEALYAADSMAEKIVDTLPEDMLREGFKLSSPDLEEDKIMEIMAYADDKLKFRSIFQNALSWSRLYGGAAVLLGIDDGQDDASQPLRVDTIKTFQFMTVLNRYELMYDSIQDDPTLAGYGMPAVYKFQPRITQRTGSADQKFSLIHATRILRFDGTPLPRKEFISNQYWSDSVLSKLVNPLRNYSTTHDSVASLMQDFSQAVFKIKNLADILSAKDGLRLVRERIDMVEMSRSVINATIIAEDEEFERKTTSLAGVQEIIRKMEERLVSASSYPHTVLLGEAPGGGIGDKGKSEHRDYYDFVSRKQENLLKDPIKRFIQYLLKSKDGPTQGKEPKSWSIQFNPLWQDSQTEIMDQRKKQAEIDAIYITNQVVSPDEVAVSRFGAGEYNHDTKLGFERDENEPIPEPELVPKKEETA